MHVEWIAVHQIIPHISNSKEKPQTMSCRCTTRVEVQEKFGCNGILFQKEFKIDESFFFPNVK